MFSWGWASQQTSPIIKLHINSMIEEGKDWLYILTERGAEIWNSSEKEDVVSIIINFKSLFINILLDF